MKRRNQSPPLKNDRLPSGKASKTEQAATKTDISKRKRTVAIQEDSTDDPGPGIDQLLDPKSDHLILPR